MADLTQLSNSNLPLFGGENLSHSTMLLLGEVELMEINLQGIKLQPLLQFHRLATE